MGKNWALILGVKGEDWNVPAAETHELGVWLLYVTGSPEDPANKEYRIWYLAVPPGGEAPLDPEELTKSFSTQRRKEVITFEYGDSGKTVYLAVQVENGDKKGPWGPMTSAVIP
jgi:hypothetical protein